MTPRGAYREIAAAIRSQIADGQLQPGAMVPSESALAERHDVARGTVRSALALLVEEGLIEVVQGAGSKGGWGE